MGYWREILLVLFIILLLFGAKRLPEMARGLGRSMRILKTEVKGLHDDDDADAQQGPAATAAGASAAPAPPTAPPQPAPVRQVPAIESGPATANADAPAVEPVVDPGYPTPRRPDDSAGR